MRREFKVMVAALAAIILFSVMALCDGVDAGSFVRYGVGAKAHGLGGAYVSIADDISATVWNPAGLGQVDGVIVGGMYTDKFGQGIYFQSLGAAANLGDFAVGLSMVRSSIEDVPYYGDGEGEFFSETQNLFLGSVSYDLGSRIEIQTGPVSGFLVGGNVKYYSHDLLEGYGSGLGFDLGILVSLEFDWVTASIGLVSQDIGTTALKWSGTDHDPVNSVPWINKLGISLGLLDNTITLASGLDVAIGRPLLNRVHVGAEIAPIEQLALRGGVAIAPDGTTELAGGISVAWQEISVDYAYVPHAILGASHILSAEFGFPAWWELEEENVVGD
jgi:hypothetical protein